MGGAGQCKGTNKRLSCGVGECKMGLQGRKTTTAMS